MWTTNHTSQIFFFSSGSQEEVSSSSRSPAPAGAEPGRGRHPPRGEAFPRKRTPGAARRQGRAAELTENGAAAAGEGGGAGRGDRPTATAGAASLSHRGGPMPIF